MAKNGDDRRLLRLGATWELFTKYGFRLAVGKLRTIGDTETNTELKRTGKEARLEYGGDGSTLRVVFELFCRLRFYASGDKEHQTCVETP